MLRRKHSRIELYLFVTVFILVHQFKSFDIVMSRFFYLVTVCGMCLFRL